MIKTIFMFILSCLFIKCEPTPYFFDINFHFISEEPSYTTADVAVEINSKKQHFSIDSTAFSICPECEGRSFFETDSGYLSKTFMTNFYEFYEDELPIKITISVFDTMSNSNEKMNFVIENGKPSGIHGCLIYIAKYYDKNNVSIFEFYKAAMRERNDSLRIQAAPITGSTDSLFVIYAE